MPLGQENLDPPEDDKKIRLTEKENEYFLKFLIRAWGRVVPRPNTSSAVARGLGFITPVFHATQYAGKRTSTVPAPKRFVNPIPSNAADFFLKRNQVE